MKRRFDWIVLNKPIANPAFLDLTEPSLSVRADRLSPRRVVPSQIVSMEQNMISKQNSRIGILLAAGLASLALGGCSSTSSGGGGTGGSLGSSGAHATGGSVSSSGSSAGGAIGTGGTSSSAGAATGGATVSGGSGNQAGGSGGMSTSTGGMSTGGMSTGSGGMSTGGGGAGKGGTGSGGALAMGGASTGGQTSGTCQKGQVKPAEVVIMGESFYAIDPKYIEKRIESNAQKAGSLGANATYRNVAVSGQNMNYIATTEWTAATQGGASVKFVIMDGGGIDCLSGGSTCSTCASTFKTLLGKMATAGVQDVLYTRYPEPGAPPGSNASLKACLDSTMPSMQTTCEGSTSPRCHWLDLRPVWVAGDTTDGLHPTTSGGDHVGDLIWSEMVKLCLAQ